MGCMEYRYKNLNNDTRIQPYCLLNTEHIFTSTEYLTLTCRIVGSYVKEESTKYNPSNFVECHFVTPRTRTEIKHVNEKIYIPLCNELQGHKKLFHCT